MTARQWTVVLVTAALFGSSFFFIKISVAEIPPLTLAAGRALLAAVILVVVVRTGGIVFPPLGRDWLTLLIVGMLTATIPYAAIAAGQTLIDSSLGGILFATIPLFTVVLAPVFLTEESRGRVRTRGQIVGFDLRFPLFAFLAAILPTWI